MAEIIIPGQFQQYSTSGPVFITDAGTVYDALRDLTRSHPMLKSYIFDTDDEIKGFVNIFSDDEMVEDLNIPVSLSTRIQIILAVAGG